MLRRKAPDGAVRACLDGGGAESVGLCQGTVLEILVAADVAEKAAGVTAGELTGSCPQHMTCLVLLGDTGAVRAAMEAVRTAMQSI